MSPVNLSFPLSPRGRAILACIKKVWMRYRPRLRTLLPVSGVTTQPGHLTHHSRMKSPRDIRPRISFRINDILSIKSCMYGLPPPLPIDIGSIGFEKSTRCIRPRIEANSRR